MMRRLKDLTVKIYADGADDWNARRLTRIR